MFGKPGRFTAAKTACVSGLLALAIPFAFYVLPGPVRLCMLTRGYVFCSLRPATAETLAEIPEGPNAHWMSSYVVYQRGEPIGVIAGSPAPSLVLWNDGDTEARQDLRRQVIVFSACFWLEIAFAILFLGAAVLSAADMAMYAFLDRRLKTGIRR